MSAMDDTAGEEIVSVARLSSSFAWVMYQLTTVSRLIAFVLCSLSLLPVPIVFALQLPVSENPSY